MSDEQPPFQPPWQPPQDPYGGPGGGSGPQGAQPRPWEQGGAWDNDQGSGPQYPRQHLLPQEIKPGRNRKPVFIAIGAALALVIAGGIAYLVFRDDGEGTRAAYCAALKDLTHNGDLASVAQQPSATLLDDLKTVEGLAPNAVADDWRTLDRGIQQAQSGEPDLSQAMSLYGALRAISLDAKNNCNLDLGIPLL